jgi:CheY-like chemotaxis protein
MLRLFSSNVAQMSRQLSKTQAVSGANDPCSTEMDSVRPDTGLAVPNVSHSERVPCARTQSGVRALRTLPGAAAQRVLLIAPDPILARQYERMLVLECGVTLTLARSLRQAIELLQHDQAFRFVLCPGVLFEGPASTFLRQVRDLEIETCPPVVVFDGSDDAHEVIEAIQLGVRQYIAGPSPPREVAKKVARLLGIT